MIHFFPLSNYNPLYNTNDLNLNSVPTANSDYITREGEE
jgi:hypothetical protein